MTIQIEAIEQYFHVVLLVMLYKEALGRRKPSEWPFKWKLLKFHVVLFIMLYKVVLPFKSVDETLVCDHSNESYWAVLSCGTVYYAVQGGSTF